MSDANSEANEGPSSNSETALLKSASNGWPSPEMVKTTLATWEDWRLPYNILLLGLCFAYPTWLAGSDELLSWRFWGLGVWYLAYFNGSFLIVAGFDILGQWVDRSIPRSALLGFAFSFALFYGGYCVHYSFTHPVAPLNP